MFKFIVVVACVLAVVAAKDLRKDVTKDVAEEVNEEITEEISTEPVKVSLPIKEAIKEPVRDLSAHKPSKDAKIKSSVNTVDESGSYQYQFESTNGILQSEGGVAGKIVQGSSQWIARSGEPLAISYIADKDGYRATGFHLPTPPPIPPQIQRALEYLEKYGQKEPQEVQDKHCCH